VSHALSSSASKPVRTTTRLLDAIANHPKRVHETVSRRDAVDRDVAERAVEVMLQAIVASAEPAVAFTSLAATTVPTFADECRIVIVDEQKAAFRIQYPRVLAPVMTHAGQVVVSRVAAEGCGAEPAYWATVTFVWHAVTDLDHSDVLTARRLTDRVADLVRQERMAVAEHDEAKVAERTGSA